MSDVIIPQTWLGNNRLIPVRGENGRIFLGTPLVPEGEEIVLEIVPLSRIQALESTADQLSKALCGKENATICEVLDAVSQLKSRLAQVERERDAAVRELEIAEDCYNCKYNRACKHDGNGYRKCSECGECPCSECNSGQSQYEWRGVCEENTKEEEK